jgi:hypothetical protein
MRKLLTFSLFLILVAFAVTACSSSEEPQEAGGTIEAIPMVIETSTPAPEVEEPEPTVEEPEAYPPPDDTASDGNMDEAEAYPAPDDPASDGDTDDVEAYPPPDDTAGENNAEETEAYPPPTDTASNNGSQPPEEAIMAAFAKAGCPGCHTIPGVPNATGTVGPNLSAIGLQASERKAGLDAEECPRDTMPPNFSELLTEDEITLLVDYLLTLNNEQ